MGKNRSMAAKRAKAIRFAIEDKKCFRAISDGAEAVMKKNPVLITWDEESQKQEQEKKKRADFMQSLLAKWEEDDQKAIDRLFSF